MAIHIFGLHPPEVIEYRYLRPNLFFSFPLFHWLHLKPWPVQGMLIHFYVMGLAACAITLGIFYRFSCFVFLMTFGYIFLIDKTYSPNPIYLYTLLTFLLLITDAHKSASLDIFRKPHLNTRKIPFWNIFIIRAQLCIVYFYAGFSKLTHSDWLKGEQMRIWLNQYSDTPVWGPLVSREWLIYAMSYGGLLFDLSIGFLLCLKKTRYIGFFLALFFHLTNRLFLGLGMFPWIMISTLVIFMEPETPRLLIKKLNHFFHCQKEYFQKPISQIKLSVQNSPVGKRSVSIFLIIYLIIQVSVPLRHWFYPSDVNWTRIGSDLSWHLMNNNMYGKITFHFPLPDNMKKFKPVLITAQQKYHMSVHSEAILQYAHTLRNNLKAAGLKDPVITVTSTKSLNGRKPSSFIDPTANLAKAKLTLLSPNTWILPHPDQSREDAGVNFSKIKKLLNI